MGNCLDAIRLEEQSHTAERATQPADPTGCPGAGRFLGQLDHAGC